MNWDRDDDDDDLIDKVSLTVRNNRDWTQPFVAQDFNPNTNQHSIHDLTGAQLRMQIKSITWPALKVPGTYQPPIIATTPTLNLETANGFIVVASLPASGQFVIVVPGVTMWASVPAGSYVGDMLVFGPDGSVKTLFTLELEVEQGDTVPTPT